MSTVTVVPTLEAANLPPRIKLDVTDVGSPNLFATTVTRLDPDGVWRPVRTADGNPLVLSTVGANRVGLLYDYEAPYGAAVSYSTLESPAVVSAEVTIPESRAWLIHPGVPSLSIPLVVAAWGARTRKVQRGVLYPMGRTNPVVRTDGARKGAEYTLSVHTWDDDERFALDSILYDASTLLINVPASKGWGVTTEYVAVGDVTEARQVRISSDPGRTWELPLTVVDAPVGGSQAERTLADLMDYSTLAAIAASYPTLSAVNAGP